MKHQQLLAAAAVIVLAACEHATIATAPLDPTTRPVAAAASSGLTLLTQTTWGGTDSDVTEGTAVGSDGSSYLVGFTRSFGGTAPKLFTIKFDAAGALAWQRTWEVPGGFIGHEARDVAVAPDGSVYVAGSTFVNGNGILLLKFASDGALLWQRSWGGNGFAQSVAVAPDGAVYVTGSTRSGSFGDQDLFVTKLSSDGTLAWSKSWGTAGATEEGQGVAVGSDGSVYVAGVAPRAGDPFAGQFDAVLLKLDAAGSLVWQQAFAGGDVTDARGGVAVAPDGSVYVGGGFQGPSGSSFVNEGLILKVAGDGRLVWARRWDGGFAEDIAAAPDGRVVFAGGANEGVDAFLARLEPNGKTVDATVWGGLGLDAGRGVGVAPDGTLSLAAVVEQPPYAISRTSNRASRARLDVTTPVLALVDVAVTLSDPAGIVETPAGTTTYAGSFDAALVRFAP